MLGHTVKAYDKELEVLGRKIASGRFRNGRNRKAVSS